MPYSGRKVNNFTFNHADQTDRPSFPNSGALKTAFDSRSESMRVALNGLIDDLMSIVAGDSGAENIGSAPITGVAGDTPYEQIVDVKAQHDALVTVFDVHNHDTRYYTKDELSPYLQGGDTTIKYEVFIIVTSNNGDGTFTYKDTTNVQYTGTLTAEGYQTFTLLKGSYGINQNRITCTINDTLQRSVASGGLVEVDTTHVTLTMPEGANAELTFMYFERIGITGEHNIVYGGLTPPTSSDHTMWFKVVG